MKLARLLVAVCALICASCSTLRREAPRPGRTTLGDKLVVLPAQLVGSYLVIETKIGKAGPFHFIIDTGSNVVLFTPDFTRRFADTAAFPPTLRDVRVRSATGDIAVLPVTNIGQLELGKARFENVAARVYDCEALSTQLGVQIDGILGFPLFRETLLTLDYPHSRVLLQPRQLAATHQPGVTISFNNATKTPLIPVKLGERTFIALIDSGRDGPLSLNPVGLAPKFEIAPRAGATVSSLTGDRVQQVGRLAETFSIGTYTLPRQHAELIDELSSIGGEVLKNFVVTFDQEHDQVTFQRDTSAVPAPPPRRSLGLSFSKTPAYWRVAGVVPGSPAASSDIENGDLVTHLNGTPVAKWDLARYERLIADAEDITLTFLLGTREQQKKVSVFNLVP